MSIRMRVSVNHRGIERLRTLAQAVRLTDRDKKGPLLKELDKTHTAQVRQAFATQGGSVRGGPWPAWSPKYAKWRRSHSGLGRRMMVLTGSLRDKFTKASHPSHIRRWLKPMKFDFGATDDVAFLHQNVRPKRRSVIDKTSRDIKYFINTLRRFWIKRIRQIYRKRGGAVAGGR